MVEALLLLLDIAFFVLLLLAVRRKENAANADRDLGFFAYRELKPPPVAPTLGGDSDA